MSTLLYSAKNDIQVERDQLADLEVPKARGRFHKPVPFNDYVDLIDHAMQQNGLRMADPEFAVTKDHNRFFGLAKVEPIEGELILADDFNITIGMRGSHDQKIPRGITLGSQVMVCSNLCFSGDIGVFNTKQTLNVWQRLPMLVREAVAKIPEMAEVQERKFEVYKNFTFSSPRHGDAFLVEAYRRGAFTAAQLSTAIDEWDQPTYKEHAEYGSSAWKLLNACTQALKPTGDTVNHDTIRQRSLTVSSFLDEVVGL